MNGRERFLCALGGGMPDRVPFLDWFDVKVVGGMARLLGWEIPGTPNGGEATRHGEEREPVLRLYRDLIKEFDLDATWSANSTNLVPETPDWGRNKYGHARRLKVMNHSDGNMRALMDEMIDLGFDRFHPVQPQCMNIAEVKAWPDGRTCVFGNVDCLDLLVFGTPEMVDAAVKGRIDAGSPGGGHVICSSDSLHPGVKPENALAMFRAAKRYGDYARVPEKRRAEPRQPRYRETRKNPHPQQTKTQHAVCGVMLEFAQGNFVNRRDRVERPVGNKMRPR